MERQSPSYELEADERRHALPPDQRLLLAVLFRAVRDFVNYRHAEDGTEQHKIAADAAGWLFWNGTEDMTFLKICETLGLEPKKIRDITLTLTSDELLRMARVVDEDDDEMTDDAAEE